MNARVIGALTAVVLVTTGCGSDAKIGDDPFLADLAAEPIASFIPTHGRLADESFSTEHMSLGKPVRAKIQRVFSFDTGREADDGRDDALALARESGWKVKRSLTRPSNLHSGDKSLGRGPAHLWISRYDKGKMFRLLIILEYT